MISVRNLLSPAGWNDFRKQRRQPVTNQGPFVPLPASKIRVMTARRFRIERAIGITPKPDASATTHEGPLGLLCRLYAMRVVKA